MKIRFPWKTGAAIAIAGAFTVPLAGAAPPGFPDLSGFSEVSADSFSTPGVNCEFVTPIEFDYKPGVRCFGTLPGVDNIPITNGHTQGDCDLGGAEVASGQPGKVWHYKGACTASSHSVLSPGQKISRGATTCGVAPGNVIACLDTSNGDHGFLLQPAGSSAF